MGPFSLSNYNVRVKRQLRDKELVVSGTNWPLFLYRNDIYNEEEPWIGLFRSSLLVKACLSLSLGIHLCPDTEVLIRHTNTSSHC
jgi:hypothetical protein